MYSPAAKHFGPSQASKMDPFARIVYDINLTLLTISVKRKVFHKI